MGGPEWAEIKKQYRLATNAVNSKYAEKRKMKVFTWTGPRYEKDTFMSPMDSLRYHRMFLQTGILAVDPTTNEIKAGLAASISILPNLTIREATDR